MNKKELQQTWDHYIEHRDLESRNQLITCYWAYVQKIATKLSQKYNHKISGEELASFGVDGLIQAVERFNPDKNTYFTTFAYSRIKGAMIDGCRDNDQISRYVRQHNAKLLTAVERERQLTGQKVDVNEVAKKLGIPEKDLYNFHNTYIITSPSSIDRNILMDKTQAHHLDFNKALTDPNPGPEEILQAKELKNHLFSFLNERERKILYLKYYMGYRFLDIKNQFGVSASQVSRIHNNSLKKLREVIVQSPDL